MNDHLALRKSVPECESILTIIHFVYNRYIGKQVCRTKLRQSTHPTIEAPFFVLLISKIGTVLLFRDLLTFYLSSLFKKTLLLIYFKNN